MRRSYQQIGSFELTGPAMRVSDPGYDKEVWCSGTISDCLTGSWDAAVAYRDEGTFGQRVAILAVKHSDTVRSFALCDQVWEDEENTHYAAAWEICGFEVGVDSGQAGFYDELHYQDQHVFDGHPKPRFSYGDIWYNHCCDQTMSEQQAGMIPYGAVSSSGFGDGGYTALMHKNVDGQVDCAVILYLAEER